MNIENNQNMKDAMGIPIISGDLVVISSTIPNPGKVVGFTANRVAVNVRYKINDYDEYYLGYFKPKKLFIVSNTEDIECSFGELLTSNNIIIKNGNKK